MREMIFLFVLISGIANAKPATLIGEKDALLSLNQTKIEKVNTISNKEGLIFPKNLQQEINRILPQAIGMSAPVAKENGQDIISRYHANPFTAIKQIKLNEANMGKTKGDWIIIDSTVIIDHDTTINSNIIIYNNSQLIVRNCSLVVKGIIYAFQNSLFSVDSTSLVIPQDYIYQFGMQVGMNTMDSSKIEIKHSKLNSSNLPLGGGVINGGSLLFDNVQMDQSFITFCTFGSKSKINIKYTDKAGEFVVLGDSSEVHISHSDTVLVWLGFPKGSSGKVYGDSLHMTNWINHFTYPDTTCNKITYSLVLDSLTGLLLATMAEDSTDIDLYNAEIRGAGGIFAAIPDTDTIIGLVNGSTYSDWTAPLPGRNYHLVNSSVAAWNLYFYAGTQLSIRSSIFGECLLADSAKSLFWNAVCDGAGGHIGAGGNSFLISGLTSLYTDALMEGHSVSIMLLTNFMYGHLIAKGMAATILYNTVLANPVLIYDSATVMVTGCYPPSPSHSNENIPIRGSAYMLRGPNSPFSFDGYKVEYAPTTDTTEFFPITDRITTPVDNDDICVFSTYGLNSGTYVIRLWYFFSAFGGSDSINFDNSIYLNWQDVEETAKTKKLSLSVTPSLSNKQVNINYVIPQATEVELSLYNVSGEKVATLDKGIKNKGNYTVKLDNKKFSNGIYFCELRAGKEILPVKKIVMMK
ncbi:MAG: T9SS type A sorting domain-containing protein [bacterium]|nr:T9SS type A sorting domain-containing protein [bacterium]